MISMYIFKQMQKSSNHYGIYFLLVILGLLARADREILLLSFTSSLKKSMQCIWIIFTFLPSILTRLSTPFSSNQILYEDFCPHQDQFMLPKYPWMCDFPLEYDHLTRGYTFKENWPFLSKKLSTALSSSTRGGIWGPTFITMFRFGLVLACTDLMHGITNILNS